MNWYIITLMCCFNSEGTLILGQDIFNPRYLELKITTSQNYVVDVSNWNYGKS